MHAASVGEVAAATPIVREYLRRRPDDLVVMSVITPGGHETAEKLVGDAIDCVVYAPFDYIRAVKRTIRAIRPDLYVVMETEIWPNAIHLARESGCRLALVNGRISDQSLPKYRRMRPLIRWALRHFEAILVQSRTDEERFLELGAAPQTTRVVGNSKFDQTVDRLSGDAADSLRAVFRLPRGAPTLVVGSTREAAEERIVLGAYGRLLRRFPDLVLVHAPRHVDRAEELERLMREAGFEPVRRTQSSGTTHEVRQLILDTFGELGRAYALADVVFVGNSLTPPGGGQNLLQPLAQGKAVIVGPYTQNFRDLTAMACDAGTAFVVRSEEELAARIAALLSSEEERRSVADRAVRLVAENRGASERYADALVELTAP